MIQEITGGLAKDAPIGVFDSGVGGLTVVREIMRQIPNEKIVYFGDTARVPYGSKSKDTVTRFSRQIVRFLQTHQVKTIVVACNTASAYALEDLERESDIFRSRMPFRRIFRHQSGKWFFPASKSHVASGRSTLRQKNKRP